VSVVTRFDGAMFTFVDGCWWRSCHSPFGSAKAHPPLRQHQGQALLVRASPAALTLTVFRVFCRHAEWLVVCRTHTMRQAQLVPGGVAYLTDFTHSFLVKFEDGKSPFHIKVGDQKQAVCHREC